MTRVRGHMKRVVFSNGRVAYFPVKSHSRRPMRRRVPKRKYDEDFRGYNYEERR